jgi:RNA polymerase sigma factor (sigma-70 family)
MHDSEVVAAIAAGDPDGLAEAYDRYAAPLYTYCRSLLREPADAADAVQDTFVIAASKVAGLRDQSRLRPWLYAVARNECHRRLRDKASAATSALDQVPEMSDESADVSEGAERAELRALLRSAVRGLGASEQDLIQLQYDRSSPATAAGNTQRGAQDDRAQRAVRRQPETDRLGRAGVVVHHGVLRPDRQAVRGSGLGPPAGRPEHDGQRQRQRGAPGPDQPGRDRGRRRGVRGLPAHHQPGRHRRLGHYRDRRHPEFASPEFVGSELSSAEFGQPGT